MLVTALRAQCAQWPLEGQGSWGDTAGVAGMAEADTDSEPPMLACAKGHWQITEQPGRRD